MGFLKGETKLKLFYGRKLIVTLFLLMALK